MGFPTTGAGWEPLEAWDDLPTVFEPQALLSFEIRMVRLLEREEELRECQEWLHSGPRVRIRFVTGPAGSGKARFAAELATSLSSEWSKLVAQGPWPSSESIRGAGQSKILVVVDRPERDPPLLAAVVDTIQSLTSHTFRLIVLSRQPYSRWLQQSAAAYRTTSFEQTETEMRPLSTVAAISVCLDTWARVHDTYGNAPPAIDRRTLGEWLSRSPDRRVPMTVLSTALSALQCTGISIGPPEGAVLWALGERERAHFQDYQRHAGFGRRGVARILGLLTLVEEGARTSALRRLAVPELAVEIVDPATIIEATRSLFCEEELGGLPEQVRAAMLGAELLENQEMAPDWLWAATQNEALNSVLAAETAVRIDRVYDAVASANPLGAEVLARGLIAMVSRRPDRATRLRLLEKHWSGPCTRRLAMAIGETLLQASKLNEEEEIDVLIDLASMYSAVGLEGDAFAAIQAANAALKRLGASTLARAHLQARTFDTMGRLYAVVGEFSGAESLGKSAIGMVQALANVDSYPSRQHLAEFGVNYGLTLAAKGASAAAIDVFGETIPILVDLRDLPRLAFTLVGLSECLAAIGEDQEQACDYAKAAAKVCRLLCDERRGRFESQLAASLCVLSSRLAELQHWEAARRVAAESVAIERETLRKQSTRSSKTLARGLDVLSTAHLALGEADLALVAAKESVSIGGELLSLVPSIGGFAASTERCCAALRELGDQNEAARLVHAVRTAVQVIESRSETEKRMAVCRELWPPGHTIAVDGSEPTLLIELAEVALLSAELFAQQGLSVEANANATEGVRILTGLCSSGDYRTLPLLTRATRILSETLVTVGRQDEAHEMATTSVSYARRLVATQGVRHRHLLANSLATLGLLLAGTGRAAESRTPLIEAQQLRDEGEKRKLRFARYPEDGPIPSRTAGSWKAVRKIIQSSR